MTQLSIAVARQDIRNQLATNFTQTAVEGSVPSAKNLIRQNGAVIPYIVYRFPDVLPDVDTSFIGPWGDSYMQMVYFLAVGPDIASAQALYMKIITQFLGFVPSYSSQMTKRSGGGTYEIGVDNGASEAYISTANFVFRTNMMLV